MLTDSPRLARLLADQSVKNQIVNNIIDNIIKLKLKLKLYWNWNYPTNIASPIPQG